LLPFEESKVTYFQKKRRIGIKGFAITKQAFVLFEKKETFL
jgi:hypothetical protein